MVHVVLHEVVLREVGDVGMLNVRNVRCSHETNIHNGGAVGDKRGREAWYEVRGVNGRVGRDEAVDWRFDQGVASVGLIYGRENACGITYALETLREQVCTSLDNHFLVFSNY